MDASAPGPDGGRGRRRSGRRRVALAAAAGVTAVVLAAGVAVVAVGDDETGPDFNVPEGVQPLGQMRAGSVAQFAECADWVEGSVERRRATVVDIREQLTSGGTVKGRPQISDQDAYDVFERACSNEFADRFLLYKLYYQANAFHGFDPTRYEQPEVP